MFSTPGRFVNRLILSKGGNAEGHAKATKTGLLRFAAGLFITNEAILTCK